MIVRSGWAAALAVVIALTGCGAGGMAAGPQVSPTTGEEYPEGTPPRDSEYTTTATLFLAQSEGEAEPGELDDLYSQALEQSLEGIQEEPDNPQNFWLAGISYAGLGQYEEANDVWNQAEELYPAYEVEIDPAREQYWVEEFNEGVEAFNAGDTQAATQHWQNANLIFPKRPEAFNNLAAVYTQEGDEDGAIEAYRGALESAETPPAREIEEEEREAWEQAREETLFNLGQLLARAGEFEEAEQIYTDYLENFPDDVSARSNLAIVLSQQGRTDEAMAIYDDLLDAPDLGPQEIFAAGVGLFQAEQYDRAAEAFEQVTEMQPNNRDAWFNWANALYAQEEHQAVIPVTEQLVEMDPANRDAWLIMAGAHRDLDQRDQALEAIDAYEALPIFVENLQLQAAGEAATVLGTVEGNTAEEGTPIRLEFTFYGENGELGTETVTVTAPAPDSTTNFEATIQSSEPVTGYRYEVL